MPKKLIGCMGKGMAQDLTFEPLGEQVTLPTTIINDVFQDGQGFLWMASWDGLFRFDGYNLQVYRSQFDSIRGPRSNKITHLFEDRAGDLWIGTRIGGVSCYNPRTATFYHYNTDNGLSNNNVWSIIQDQDGIVWIGTEDGLNRLNPENRQIQTFKWYEMPGQNFINSLLIRKGKIWIGSEGGLFVWNPNHANRPPAHIPLAGSESNDSPTTLEIHNYVYKVKASRFFDDIIWVGTKGGLKEIRLSGGETHLTCYQKEQDPTKGLSDNFVRDFIETAEGGDTTLWLGTYRGLNRFDLKKRVFQSYFAHNYIKGSINNNCINSLALDRSGILWVGTNKGINKLNLQAKAFRNIRLDQTIDPSKRMVESLTGFSKDHYMWFGTAGGGIARLKEGENDAWQITQFEFGDHKKSATVNFISNVLFDQEENLWVTTKGEGIIKIPVAMWHQSQTELKGYQTYGLENGAALDDYVMASYHTQAGNLWFGHWDGGLDCYLVKEDRFIPFTRSSDGLVDFTLFPNVMIYETFDDTGNYIWVGTRGGGLYQMRFDSITAQLNLVQHFTKGREGPGHISNSFLGSAYLDSKKRFWVGTEDGLNVWLPGDDHFLYLNTANGLPNEIIRSIGEDEQGDLWVGTAHGLSRLKWNGGEIRTHNFFQEHGLQDNDFSFRGAEIDPQGRLFMSGVNGISYFNPLEIQPDKTPPQVALVNLSLFNQSIRVHEPYEGNVLLTQPINHTQELTLTHRDRVISLAFTGLHYGQPANNQYAYMLEGFDQDWVYTDAQHRIAHYTNLPYQTYTFKVKAANADGVWNKVPQELTIKINPPWWLTPWAKFGYVGLFVGLLWGVWRVTRWREQLRSRLTLESLEREKLEEVDRLKNLFFTNISHELRTPLTLILAPLEDLIKAKTGDLSLRETFTRMFRNGQLLLTMINQILDLRKSDEGMMQMAVAEGNMVKFIREVVISFKSLATHQGVGLIFEPTEEPIDVWYDRDQMEKVLFNLISNALKFTGKGGTVKVLVERDAEKQLVRIQVKDSGTGVPSEDLPYIFERFYQANNQQRLNNGNGSGIGLALSKVIVEQHHGRIEVESQVAVGSTFTIYLPLGGDHFTTEQKLTDFKHSEDRINYLLRDDETDTTASPEELAVTPPTVSPSQKHRILIIEDNPDIRAYLSEHLGKAFEIKEAENGQQGLAIARDQHPDLIISDIAMPVMDGIELCKEIKSDINTSHIPVILLTARTSLLYKLDGYETGADDYVTKPFQMPLLLARIHNLISTRTQLRSKFSKGGYELTPSQVAVGSLDETFLQKVISLVEEHMDNSEFSVELMGREIGMSRMQLYRKIKALTGESPNQVIRKIRLKRAAQLLETQQFTVAEVTYQVGFQDLKYFRERFKKEFGMSPSTYANTFQTETS